jgi:putative transposase
MRERLRSLLLLLAGATEKELAAQVQFLKEENAILRGKLPARITVTPQERRRLLKFGKPLGQAIKALISIVSPRTFARWLQADKPGRAKPPDSKKTGRPPTEQEIRDLIVRLAEENGWGYTRIQGELKKLGIKVGRGTIAAILKENGFEPGQKRGPGTWAEFISRHAQTLWACDFFTKKVWTCFGLVDVFVLVLLLCGRPHNNSYVVKAVMWRWADSSLRSCNFGDLDGHISTFAYRRWA